MTRKLNFGRILLVLIAITALAALVAMPVSARGFQRYPVITLDGEDYYWEGPADSLNGEKDVPGHY